MAQDEHTRQYHTVDAKTFVSLTDGSWERDEIMSISYTGNVALIDPATQVMAHIYDSDTTPQNELQNFELLIAEEIMKRMQRKPRGGKP